MTSETGCIDCDPENHDGDEYRCPTCLPAFEAWCREHGGRDGCGDPACPHEVTHAHEVDGSLPTWLIESLFEDIRRAAS